jgi:hypothetical protein
MDSIQPAKPSKNELPQALIQESDKKKKRFKNFFNLTILYKLLNDLLFLEIIFFLLALIGEGLLPGVVTAHVGFSKIIIFCGITILAIYFSAIETEIEISRPKINKKAAFLLILLLVIFLFASLIKISLILNIILSFSVVIASYYIYKLVLANNG